MKESKPINSGETPSLESVLEDIKALYKDDVEAVINIISEGKNCILTGVFQNGKSSFLIPQLRDRFESMGSPTYLFDGQNPTQVVEFLHATELTSGVAILDEAGAIELLMGEKRIDDLAEKAKEHGIALIPLISHSSLRHGQEIRDKCMNKWQFAFYQHFTNETQIYNLPLIRLHKPLAKQYFMALINESKYGEMPPEEIIDYIIKTVPGNLTLLNQISWDLSSPHSSLPPMWQALQSIRLQSEVLEIALTQEEASRIKKAVNKGLRDMFKQLGK